MAILTSPAGAKLRVLKNVPKGMMRKTGFWVEVVSAPPTSRFIPGKVERLILRIPPPIAPDAGRTEDRQMSGNE